ncbi:MAG: response regulator transcription factor [Nitrospira sp.]|nr:response regulator transcription factor [Nitrospira sp.]
MGNKKQHTTNKDKVNIFIVDDHPIVRQGLTQLINNEADLMVCGQAEDAHTAMEGIAAGYPDMVIVDLSLQGTYGTNGIDLIKNIKVHYPNLYILVLSMHDEYLFAERAIRAGAKGYVIKNEATEILIAAIRRVLSGRIYLNDRMSESILNRFLSSTPRAYDLFIENLSNRELEVFQLIGQGWGTRQIAEKLHLSVKTIETYRENIKVKLNLKDASEMLRQAIQWVHSKKFRK